MGDSGNVLGAMRTKRTRGRLDKPNKYLHPRDGITAHDKIAKNTEPIAQKNCIVIIARPLIDVGIYSAYKVHA